MEFPQSISFTLTNVCNLRCQMCGQWSESGYVRNRPGGWREAMTLADWQRLVDEIAAHGVTSVLLRGGEPFLLPGILELLEHIHRRGIFISIDTNGTLVKKYAAELVRLGQIHLTFSVDGPREIHDAVRGQPGCFDRLSESVAVLLAAEQTGGRALSKSITFTLSPYSLPGLAALPAVARQLGIQTVCMVPYYYVPPEVGETYTRELRENFDCAAFSWQGFRHARSGIDFDAFRQAYRQYRADLGPLRDYPYLPLTEEEYRLWFRDALTPVGPLACGNVEKFVDVQPDGSANFCTDFPDYTFGNVKEFTLETLWNSDRARRFRDYRRAQPLAVCYRCGAKYMSASPN